MREKGTGVSSLLWRVMIGVMLIVSAEAFAPHVQAQRRSKVARARNHNRGVAAQSVLKPGDVVSLTAVCTGKLEYQDSPGSNRQDYENVTIDFRGDTFSIDGANPSFANGKLSVITRSRNRKHLSLSVNLTASPTVIPVFSISLRGCYNRFNVLCEEPARGQGAIDNKFRLKNAKGDLRHFYFESDSCTSGPEIVKMNSN